MKRKNKDKLLSMNLREINMTIWMIDLNFCDLYKTS